jgi:hypothetical protein
LKTWNVYNINAAAEIAVFSLKNLNSMVQYLWIRSGA